MGGRFAGLITLSTSPITIIIFSMILKIRVDGHLRPKSTSFIITTYINPLIKIITTYINPLFTIINTYITPIIYMTNISCYMITINILVNRTRINWDTQQSTTTTWVVQVIVVGMRPIFTSPVKINSWSTILRVIVSGILINMTTSTIVTTLITTIINYTILKLRVDGLKRPISTSSITRSYSKTFIFRNIILIKMLGGRLSDL